MLHIAALVLLSAGLSVSLICPDGKVCPDTNTYCKTEYEHMCCHYSNAVCCPDLTHCCPEGFHCNMQTQMCDRPRLQGQHTVLMKTKAEEPMVRLVPLSGSPAKGIHAVSSEDECCLHGRTPCPVGIQCKEQGVSVREEDRGLRSTVILCDIRYFCPDGSTCCKKPTGQWGCCPYSLGYCCQDGEHCCEYGYKCDETSLKCIKGYLSFPSAHMEAHRV